MEVALTAVRLVVVVGVVEGERRPPIALEDEHMAAVRLGQQTLVEDEVGGAGRHHAAVEERGLLEPLGRAQEVVGGGDDGPPGTRLRLEHVHELLLGRGVDAGDRLVEEVQIRLGGERTRQEDAPALTTGERSDLACRRDPPCRPFRARRRPARDRRDPADRPMPMRAYAAHHHDVLDSDRELPVDGLRLGQVGDRRAARARRLAEHLDPSRRSAGADPR